MNRCGLCGKVLKIAVTGAGFVRYCSGCGAEWPAEIEGYNAEEDYTTPDGRFQFAYRTNGHWDRFDMWDGDTDMVLEEDLPPDLILLSEWQNLQRQARNIAATYGEVRQLAFDGG